MSHTIPVAPCTRALATPPSATLGRIAEAAAAADLIAAAVEAEVGRLVLIGEDTAELRAVAAALGALHGELDEIGHRLVVTR